MSMPSMTYCCNKCSYRQCDVSFWGAREYSLSNGARLPVAWRLGWCEDCGGLAAVESFSGGELSEAIWNADQTLPRMPIRSPICLSCGSARITAPQVRKQEELDGGRKPQPAGFIHLGCGGEIRTVEEDFRFALRPSIRSYTPNGKFIGRVFTDGLPGPAQ